MLCMPRALCLPITGTVFDFFGAEVASTDASSIDRFGAVFAEFRTRFQENCGKSASAS
jgi:hypothetical protein